MPTNNTSLCFAGEFKESPTPGAKGSLLIPSSMIQDIRDREVREVIHHLQYRIMELQGDNKILKNRLESLGSLYFEHESKMKAIEERIKRIYGVEETVLTGDRRLGL